MELFDKKFVYLEWADVLKGKEVFVGDTLSQLKEKLHSELFVSVVENKGDYPFTTSEDAANIAPMNFAMAYYDPNYFCKKAYAQGKMIQTRNSNARRDWADCQAEPQWKDGFEYRVKPEQGKKWRPFKDVAELKQAWNFKRGPIVHSDIEEPGIWVRDKKRPDITRLITGFNGGYQRVAIAGEWLILEGLFSDYEFLDGTPCGVEE